MRQTLPWPALRRGRQLLLLALLAGLWLGSQALDSNRLLEIAAGRSAKALAGARALTQMLEKAQGLDEEGRLAAVNDFYNRRIQFRDDQDVWGVVDYWASPLETLEKGRGDCEDYAIAKYFSLLALGLEPTQLRLVYVRALLDGRPQAHMVLAYYAQPQSEPLILDNLQAQVRPASSRTDLSPVFSFNSEGLWSGVAGASAGNPTTRLSQWRDALGKARAEGF
ncbi:transglutaminase-like cysteine peptidase [Mitsuaria sp. WAJ17]|uniref:transglutaminase-like cysteine peptidase n=1 Tax=Mitsuaria sp. WAJ17 TaxID=2761452 RepID=UPI0021058AFB|nr:transglutaminase-like cysteine peptidase [Mitsuaria sp. WAJ17]